MKTLVVSRFNEEIDWIKQIENWNVIIYNKGEKLDVTL